MRFMTGLMAATARLIFCAKSAILVTAQKTLTLISVWRHAESLFNGAPNCRIVTQESDMHGHIRIPRAAAASRNAPA